jgi:hypothetical protein
LDESLGDGEADARCAAGDNGRPASQVELVHLSISFAGVRAYIGLTVR